MKKIKYLWPLVSVIAVLLTTVGVTYAWFAHSASLVTLLEIQSPDTITITPVGEDGTELAALDLDFKEGVDSKKEDGTITILRPVRIKSTSPVHQLEVVHTTNLNKLEFKIYPATISEEGFDDALGENLSGRFINPNSSDSHLAEKENLNNYKEGDSVEAHAYPLYWLADCCGDKRYVQEEIAIEVSSKKSTEFDAAKQCDVDYYSTYYILEISWQETTKETDLFYILAQNIAVTPADEGGGNPG